MLNKSLDRRRLQATGFLGFLDPQKHSAATQPVQEAVAASPIESSQRMLTHRTVTEFGRPPLLVRAPRSEKRGEECLARRAAKLFQLCAESGPAGHEVRRRDLVGLEERQAGEAAIEAARSGRREMGKLGAYQVAAGGATVRHRGQGGLDRVGELALDIHDDGAELEELVECRRRAS
jgi:hypothetical protein